MKEYVISYDFKFSIFANISGLLAGILCLILQFDKRTTILSPFIIIICCYGLFKATKKKGKNIIFNNTGITLPNEKQFNWEDIILLEFKKPFWDTNKMFIHTVDGEEDISLDDYDVSYKNLKEYMDLNHPTVKCDIYVLYFLGIPIISDKPLESAN